MPAYLDPKHPLPKHDMSHASINVLYSRVARCNHVAILELHSLGTLSAQLARDNDLTALGSTLHDESQYTIACSASSQAASDLCNLYAVDTKLRHNNCRPRQMAKMMMLWYDSIPTTYVHSHKQGSADVGQTTTGAKAYNRTETLCLISMLTSKLVHTMPAAVKDPLSKSAD